MEAAEVEGEAKNTEEKRLMSGTAAVGAAEAAGASAASTDEEAAPNT